MEHPFIQDLSNLSLEELQTKLTDINNKLSYAYKTRNTSLISQINMVLESYRNAYNKKMDELIDKQKTKTKIDITTK